MLSPAREALVIRIDDLQGPEILSLLDEHLRNMRDVTPPESVHALDLTRLKRPDLTVWTAWSHAEILGCGALREIDAAHGEIKFMRTASAHRRKGVARAMLGHLLAEARRRGYRRVSLETGAMDAFAPARTLYQRAGFTHCGPFAEYTDDPNSVFMTRELE